MCERKDAERVVAVKLVPMGSYEIRCVPIFQKGPRIEVGPIFRDKPAAAVDNISAEIEKADQNIEWFRKYGDA